MTRPGPHFPEYGDGGDEIGARRSRRAFRRSVIALTLATGMLFVSENFLRYDHVESLYRSAITYPVSGFPSARTVLRSAVKQDAALHATPTAKYLEALAEREEEDRILPTFAKAYKVDPQNSSLAIRYGCALAANGKPRHALDVFKGAASEEPRNNLPVYLEAAVTGDTTVQREGPQKSLVIVARANSSDNKIVFPKPLWFPGLPQSSACYQQFRRRIIDECCAPLRHYAAQICDLARKQIKKRHVQNWDAWLGTLQDMGKHLAEQSEPGSRQVLAGLEIELNALQLRQQIHQMETGRTNPGLAVKQHKINAALTVIRNFESHRKSAIARDRSRYQFAKWLWVKSLLLILGIYFLAVICAKSIRPHAMYWTIPHRRWGWAFPVVGCLTLALALEVGLTISKSNAQNMAWVGPVWWFLLIFLTAFGLFYPATVLPGAPVVCARQPALGDDSHILKKARAERRRAYVVLARRYYGILTGSLISATALWILGFRVVTGIYPHYVDLLTTGMLSQELAAVARALALLH